MKITKKQLQRTIRKVILEVTNFRGEEMYTLAVDDLNYWADWLRIDPDHAFENVEGGWKKQDDTEGIWAIIDGSSIKLYIGRGKTDDEYHLVVDAVGERNGFGTTSPLGNVNNLQDQSNEQAFAEVFDTWEQMTQGHSRGAW